MKKEGKVSVYKKELQDLLHHAGKGAFADGKADWRALELLSINEFDVDVAQVCLLIVLHEFIT